MPLFDTNYSQPINTDLARGLLNIRNAGLDGGSQLSPFADEAGLPLAAV